MGAMAGGAAGGARRLAVPACGRDGCGGGKLSECLGAIPASRVLAALDELLQETGR